MVPPSSHGISRAPRYSGSCSLLLLFVYVTLTLSRQPSQTVRLKIRMLNAVRTPKEFLLSVWPLPRSLATTYGISVDFSSSPYLDVSVQAVPLHMLLIHIRMHELLHADCSIRKSADQCLLTTPRCLSQLTTSFFGSQCQGIHSALFFALPFVRLVLLRIFASNYL